MWFDNAVIYQIYPLGLCGAPRDNDGVPAHRILQLLDWVDHIRKTGADTVLLNPVFESDRHGYDTRDYCKVDCRLGTNEDLKTVCDAFHKAGLRVMLDGVFNHVGRGFHAFEDVRQKKWDSPYKDWFRLSFDGNSNYNDGFWYEGWEGHYELVKLNLQNPAVVDYLLDCVGGWMEEFSIDGLRLDVAYLLDENFMRRLHSYVRQRDEGFFLLGEMIHGDYKRIVNDDMLDSATNYECYKGLYSAFNSLNMFEIAHSLARQFGPEPWTLYKGMHLFSFCDNHDVTRIASILQDKQQINALYAVLFCMPGIPCVYYGSEWGAEGEKHQGDPALRPCFEKPLENDLTEFLGKLSRIKSSCVALKDGGFQNLTLRNKQWIFVRQCPAQTVIVAVNAEENPCQMECAYNGPTVELLTGEKTDLHGTVELPGYGVKIYKMGA